MNSFSDPTIYDLIQRPKGSVKFLSPKVQNELLQILGDECKANLLAEIRKSDYFSLILDSTQDLAKVRSRVAVAIRVKT